MFTSTGKINWRPKLHKARPDAGFWAYLMCDDGLVKYYRHLYKKHHYDTKHLNRPAWNGHITFIRGEKPPNFKNWGIDSDRVFTFEYNVGDEFDTNGSDFWLPVNCPELLDIRELLRLPRFPRFPLHLTFGNTNF